MTRRLRTLSPLLLAPFLFTGCAALSTSAPESWVKADRARYNSIGVEYLEYVNNDASLEQRQKDTRLHNVQAWDVDLKEHEATLAKPAQP